MRKLPDDHILVTTAGDPTPKQHNYEIALQAAMDAGVLKPGQVSNVDVAHDDDCAIYDGGFCDCECEIRIKEIGPCH